jgi:hypothetical protein
MPIFVSYQKRLTNQTSDYIQNMLNALRIQICQDTKEFENVRGDYDALPPHMHFFAIYDHVDDLQEMLVDPEIERSENTYVIAYHVNYHEATAQTTVHAQLYTMSIWPSKIVDSLIERYQARKTEDALRSDPNSSEEDGMNKTVAHRLR